MPPAGNKPPRCGSPRELEGRLRPDSGQAGRRRVPAAILSTFLRWSVSSSAGWARLFSGWDETLAGRHVFTFLTLAAPLWDESWRGGRGCFRLPTLSSFPKAAAQDSPGGSWSHHVPRLRALAWAHSGHVDISGAPRGHPCWCVGCETPNAPGNAQVPRNHALCVAVGPEAGSSVASSRPASKCPHSRPQLPIVVSESGPRSHCRHRSKRCSYGADGKNNGKMTILVEREGLPF